MEDRDFEKYDIRLTNFENEISGYQIGAVLPIEPSRFSRNSSNSIEYQGLELMISVETIIEEMESLIVSQFANDVVTFNLEIDAQIYAKADVEFDSSGQLVATRLDTSSFEIERLDNHVQISGRDENLARDREEELLEDISIEDIILNSLAAREIIYKLINDAKFELITNE